jgi:hypothetical protein
MPLKQILVLFVTIFAILLAMIVAVPLLGHLGGLAKDSPGSDGQGFSVNESTIDKGAEITLVWVPTGLVTGIGMWMFVSVLALLAFRGAV